MFSPARMLAFGMMAALAPGARGIMSGLSAAPFLEGESSRLLLPLRTSPLSSSPVEVWLSSASCTLSPAAVGLLLDGWLGLLRECLRSFRRLPAEPVLVLCLKLFMATN